MKKQKLLGDFLQKTLSCSPIPFMKLLIALIFFTTFSMHSENVYSQANSLVKGLVTDKFNEPIVGASVRLKGTSTGTMTDVDGKFSIQASSSDVLTFTYLGYQTQDIQVGNKKDVTVTLKEDSKMIDEVVVTGFGLAQKKVTLTGAISTIGSKDIERSSSPNTSGALVGKIAGLNTRQTDGRPGSGTEIRIRNMGRPLYVIDGIQSDESQFNNIDFNDIESIAVLKDASASIYGVRAANGVIVVTTKKGLRNTKNTVTINTYYGMQDNFKFATPADAKTYVKSYVQSETMMIKAGRMNESQRRYSREEYDKWMDGTQPGYQSFDWYDYIWNSAPQYYGSAGISGGSDKSNYYVSLGHLNQDATVNNYGGFKRTNVQMNLDTDITDRFKMGVGMNGRIESRENPGVPGGDDYWLPRFGVFRNIPTRGPFANNNPQYPQIANDDPNTNFAILSYDKSGKLTEDWRVMQLQANAEYKIFKGLKAKALGSYYFADKCLDIHEYSYKFYSYDPVTDTYPVTLDSPGDYRERTREHVEEMTSNIQLNYDNKFGLHTINAVAGLESITRKNPYNKVITDPTANNMNKIYYSEIKSYEDRLDETQARLGWVGRVNYNYADKYLLELSGRYDGSWKFPPNDRWGFFPSASVGWRISEESFWQKSKMANVFNDFKLRASYGLVGDDDLGDAYNAFGYMSGYDFNKGGAVIGNKYVIGSQPRGLPVKTMSWIKAKIFDVGFDAGFLNSRLTAQFDYFRRERTGLPESRYDVIIPKEAGFDLPKENLNSDMNMGADGSIRWADKAGEFNYSIGVNATYARFYDWYRYDDRRANSWDKYRNSISHRYGYLNWGLEAIGQFQNWDEIANYPIDNDRRGNTTVYPGDIKYKDVNGDGVINGMDERPIGFRQDATPIFNGGLNLACAWKGFDLGIDFSGSLFQTYFQQWEQARAFQNNANNPQWLLEDSWRLSDPWDANSEIIPGKYPMAIRDRPSDNTYWGSTFWKHNVRYMKLRNLEFGYTLPKSILSKVQISSLRVYVSGTNLFALTNVQGVDPEQKDDNGLGYPTMRVLNIGLNLKF